MFLKKAKHARKPIYVVVYKTTRELFKQHTFLWIESYHVSLFLFAYSWIIIIITVTVIISISTSNGSSKTLENQILKRRASISVT